MGTGRTIACAPIVKRISLASPIDKYKNPPCPTTKSSCSSSPFPTLEFHPYAYVDFRTPTSFPHTPHSSMSDFSVNPSNESPATTPPQSPILPIPFNPVPTTVVPTYPLLSPQTAINVLASQPDLNETVRAIAYGLVSTVHNRKVLHALQSKGLQDTNAALQDRIKGLEREANDGFNIPLRPVGYEDNEGRVSTQVPIGGGYYADAKWVQLRDDGRVNLLVGKEFNEEPYSTDLYLSPSYSDEVAAPLPCWFSNILTGPSPAYHALRKAVSDLDDWNAVAEIERYRRYDDHRRRLADEFQQVQAELVLVDDAIAAARHRLEAARIPALIPNLEGRAFSLPHTGRRVTNKRRGRGRVDDGSGDPN